MQLHKGGMIFMNNSTHSTHSTQKCIFCKIIDKELESQILFEDEHVIAFRDTNPISTLHILIVTKEHVKNILDIPEISCGSIMHSVVKAIKVLSHQYTIDNSGFRLVNNCGKYGGQTVDHLHFHLIGGRQMEWPPG